MKAQKEMPQKKKGIRFNKESHGQSSLSTLQQSSKLEESLTMSAINQIEPKNDLVFESTSTDLALSMADEYLKNQMNLRKEFENYITSIKEKKNEEGQSIVDFPENFDEKIEIISAENKGEEFAVVADALQQEFIANEETSQPNGLDKTSIEKIEEEEKKYNEMISKMKKLDQKLLEKEKELKELVQKRLEKRITDLDDKLTGDNFDPKQLEELSQSTSFFLTKQKYNQQEFFNKQEDILAKSAVINTKTNKKQEIYEQHHDDFLKNMNPKDFARYQEIICDIEESLDSPAPKSSQLELDMNEAALAEIDRKLKVFEKDHIAFGLSINNERQPEKLPKDHYLREQAENRRTVKKMEKVHETLYDIEKKIANNELESKERIALVIQQAKNLEKEIQNNANQNSQFNSEFIQNDDELTSLEQNALSQLDELSNKLEEINNFTALRENLLEVQKNTKIYKEELKQDIQRADLEAEEKKRNEAFEKMIQYLSQENTKVSSMIQTTLKDEEHIEKELERKLMEIQNYLKEDVEIRTNNQIENEEVKHQIDDQEKTAADYDQQFCSDLRDHSEYGKLFSEENDSEVDYYALMAEKIKLICDN